MTRKLEGNVWKFAGGEEMQQLEGHVEAVDP
jgi:hypothetical protein